MLLQICYGQVTTVHLYQGAFVNIGCVHEGYVHWILLHDEFTMNLVYLI
jgi:predicted RNA-binding protein with RPS1 domain